MSQEPSSMGPQAGEPLGQPVDLSYSTPARVSGMAVASMVLGILAIPLGCVGVGIVLGLVAVILGIVALTAINREPERLGGKGYAITGIVTGAVGMILIGPAVVVAIMLPPLGKGGLTNRTACAANLTGLMKSMILYSAENNDYFPYLGTANIEAMPAVSPTPTKFVGGCLMNDMYYFVGTGMVAPKQFVCKSDSSAIPAHSPTEAKGNPPYDPPYWANGNTSRGGTDYSYSYSFAYQYSDHKTLANFWKNTMDSAVAIGADLNPGNAAAKYKGNSPNHEGDGQNVVYADCHVDFQRTANCGEAGDGIYTTGKAAGGTVGMPGLPLGASGNAQGTFDTCLVPGVVDATSMRRE